LLNKVLIEKYFDAEKSEAIVFLVVGLLAMVLAIVLAMVIKSKWSIGFLYPMIALALLQCVVGWTVFRASDAQRIAAVYAYDLDPNFLKNLELPRMEKVMRNFVIYRYTECAVLLIGVALLFFFRNQVDTISFGVGLGLCVQCVFLLTLDFFAESRGKHYLNALEMWLNQRQ
jgi:hypothetical protein